MAKIDFQELDRELKQGKIRPVYILVGSEHHLALDSLNKIKKLVLGEKGSDLAVRIFTGREVRAEDVLVALKTVSFFGERPLVIIREGETVSKDALEAIAEYAGAPIESATLVVVAEKLDGRSRLMQLAAKTGAIIECKPLYLDKVPSWINMEAKKQGRPIAQDAAKFLAEMIGPDLGQLLQAIERIILYIGEKKLIELGDVEQAVSETHQHDVFELTDAVGGRRIARAISLLHNIIGNGEAPVLVLNMLCRHFRILSKAKDISSRITEGPEMAKYLGVHPYFVKNYLAQARNFSGLELKRCFRTLHRCDKELKSSRVNKERIMEKALFSLMR